MARDGKPGKQSAEHLRAVQERRRSNAAGTHDNTQPRSALRRQAIEEGIEDVEDWSASMGGFPKIGTDL